MVNLSLGVTLSKLSLIMKTFLVNSAEQLEAYNKFVSGNELGNLWQSEDWGSFQASVGKKALRFLSFDTLSREEINLPGKVVASAQVVVNKLPMGKKWWYVPRGPLWENAEGCKDLVNKLAEYGKKSGVIFILFDPFVNLPEDLETWPSKSVQPENTLVVDLRKSEDDILAQMKSKGRYNIRLAKRKGVEVRRVESVGGFYSLLEKTTERDGFRGWGKKYYEKMVKNLGDKAVVFEAVHEGDIIASGIFTYFEKQAVYYYGASSNHKRNLMAPYLVQWEAILEGKKRGCTEYDFLGIAPEGVANHEWAGVTGFKEKFGGERRVFPSARKIIIKPVWNMLYGLVKKVK